MANLTFIEDENLDYVIKNGQTPVLFIPRSYAGGDYALAIADILIAIALDIDSTLGNRQAFVDKALEAQALWRQVCIPKEKEV